MKREFTLDLELISHAISTLKNQIVSTPIENSSSLTSLLDVPVIFKVESMQITGSFKVRGALFYLSTLHAEEKKRGVAACSAGNHGLGVAYACQRWKIPCTIYVPKSVDHAKHEKILKLGAQVIRSEFDGYDETLEWSLKEVEKKGSHFISAFEDDRIMAANGGSLAAEIFEAVPDVENLLFPVGGGGLAAGIAYYFKKKAPHVRLIGCQHKDSPALMLSLKKNKAITALPPIETIAGGIEGGIGEKCFEILKDKIDDVMLVDEEEISEAFRWMLTNHQLLIEPSAVVTVSACLSPSMPKLTGKTVVLLSGRNVSYQTLQRLVGK